MGVKDITSWLNANGLKHRASAFYCGTVHKILRKEAYAGRHYFNRQDSRTRRERPGDEWILVPVPEIISEHEFRSVQDRLCERRPNVTAPRITSSEVLLTGLVRCNSCGAPLMLSTGKSGRYRYYACSSRRLKGKSACSAPIAVPEAQLDGLVISALADKLLTSERLPTVLREAQRHRRETASGNVHRRSQLRKRIKELETQIGRLYDALAEGTVSDKALFRSKLSSIEAERDECIQLLSRIDAEAPPFRRALSNAQAAALAAHFKQGLLEAPKPLQRRYVRGLVSNISVDKEKAVISGPRSAIAAAVTAGAFKTPVLTSVREWRTRRDSNS